MCFYKQYLELFKRRVLEPDALQMQVLAIPLLIIVRTFIYLSIDLYILTLLSILYL